ncbi:MAG: response regulator [Oscillospiraceae bacterium]|jgi:putative two-component system response regulator|nr:response regulator [Oscillospiraceae bacterium]
MDKDTILIVDDVEINRILLSEYLGDDYDTIEAEDGEQALDVIFNQHIIPAGIMLDIIMPGKGGFEVLAELKADPATANIPVLLITAADSREVETKGLKAGASDYVPKPFEKELILTRLGHLVELRKYQQNLEFMVEQKTAELMRTYEQTLEVLATVVEYRSLESGEHIKRTALLSELLISFLVSDPSCTDFHDYLTPSVTHSIVRATTLHDIGKIGISDTILLKAGRLTDEEFELMKEHTVIGCKLIDEMLDKLGDNAGYMNYCREICYYHHERWDGNGYPTGLKGEEIPLSARILSIVDVYDALVNKRVYKPAYSHDEAVEIIREGRGRQFDPRLVDAFIAVAPNLKKIEDRLGD